MDEDHNEHTKMISLYISPKSFIEMKVMCLIMNKSMSAFIRSAIQEKMKTLKETKDQKNKWN